MQIRLVGRVKVTNTQSQKSHCNTYIYDCVYQDPKEFLVAYESMMEFLHDDNHWPDIEQELSLKGVKALTFYDIVLDYILMDAFEELDSPPSSLSAVVQNRWLSNGFKETVSTCRVNNIL